MSSWSELKASSDAGMQIRRMSWLLVGTYERRLLFCLSALTHGSKDYVSQIGITHCERRRRHRARCVRGISREVSPSASSIPDAIVRVEVWTERLCDRQFALGGNNYERFKSLSGSNFRFYYLSNNRTTSNFQSLPDCNGCTVAPFTGNLSRNTVDILHGSSIKALIERFNFLR